MINILIIIGLFLLLYIAPIVFIIWYGIHENLDSNSTIGGALEDAFYKDTIPPAMIILAPILNWVISWWLLGDIIFAKVINRLNRIKVK